MTDHHLKYLVAHKYQELSFSQHTSYLVAQYHGDKWRILAEHQPDLIHKSASMIKVLILSTLMNGNYNLNESLSISKNDVVEGGGAIQEIYDNLTLSLQSLASLMLTLSDNTATNVLIDFLGMDRINDHAKNLQLCNTRLQRKMMDFDAANKGKENFMTVQDYFKLLKELYSKRNLARYDLAWQMLGRQQFRDCLPGFWDEDILFHHKTGELDFVVHDGGIIETPTSAYALICFSSNGDNNFSTKYKMANLGKSIYNFINNK